MLCRRTLRLASYSSLASGTLPAQCRLVYTHAQIPRGDDLGPTRDDSHQTYRTRRHRDAKELPLPPLLDPVALEKRSKWENIKARASHSEFTPFQKKLQANPYAHALASNVRQCRATLISLPKAFLTTLHARPHPTTHDPWLLPVSLTTDKKHLGPPFSFVGSQFIATQLGKKKSWERGIYSRFEEKYGMGGVKKMVWREDMPHLVLDLMQKQLVDKLSWNFGFRGRLTPVASPRAVDIDGVEDVSCVLIFRSLRTYADEVHDRAKDMISEMDKWSSYILKSYIDKLDPHTALEVTHRRPTWYIEPLVPRLQPRIRFPELEFYSTLWRGSKVAVYSLTDLLGEDKARLLIEGSKYADQNCVVMKQARHNVPVGILLMRLQAYITRPGP